MENNISFGNGNSGLQIGINNGSITAQFSALERREAPPNPQLIIPYRRDPDFIDRGTLLDQIHERCSEPKSRIALVGLGGIGKSQLAIEYAHRVEEQSPETWILWIHGSTAARFEESCQEIADELKIAGREEPKANVFQLICNWLNGVRKGKWILFLDSVDDDQFLHEIPPTSQDGPENGRNAIRKPFSACIPKKANGTIILTTRSRSVATRFVRDDEIINVQPMEEPHALALFERKLLGMEADEETTRKLAAALEFMPLAIVQAAAYIKRHCSVSQYLETFLESDHKKMSLLDEKRTASTPNHQRDREATNSIMATWKISFVHIKKIQPSAAKLLSLMSFFDRQGIDRALIEDQTNPGTGYEIKQCLDGDFTSDDHEDNATESSINDGFQDDINTLSDYMLISSDQVTVEMHGLVQLAMRRWLEAHGQLEHWKGVFIRIVTCQFPPGKYENWEQCQRLFRHARSAAAQQPSEETILQDWARLMYNAAWYTCERGHFIDSEEMAEKSMKARIQMFGPDHELTISSKSILGMAYQAGGRWKEAEQITVQALETGKQILGPKHPDTLTSMSNLASIYWKQRQWKKAEELNVQVLETRKQVLGPEHPVTLISMGNLASTYRNQGQWKKAEELNMHIMETRKQMQGPEHPATLISMGNLASTYCSQGQWKKAEELEIQVMETRSQVLGPEHPATLISMSNLASTYRNQGQWKKAEELNVQVVETGMQVLGPEHPDTLISMSNLAHTWKFLEKQDDALTLMTECVHLRHKTIGHDHPHTVSSKIVLIKWQGEAGSTSISSPAELEKPGDQEDTSRISTENSTPALVASQPNHEPVLEQPESVPRQPRRRKREILSRIFRRNRGFA